MAWKHGQSQHQAVPTKEDGDLFDEVLVDQDDSDTNNNANKNKKKTKRRSGSSASSGANDSSNVSESGSEEMKDMRQKLCDS